MPGSRRIDEANRLVYSIDEVQNIKIIVSPDIQIKYKSGKKWELVSADDIGTYVTVTYINKGKVTVMISGNGDRYVGSKTAIFNIVPKSIK